MFKLVKIINSGINVPETLRLKKDPEIIIKQGCAIVLSAGIAVNCGSDVSPEYIAIADAPIGSDEVLCFEVTEDMRFEVTLTSSLSTKLLGVKTLLAIDDDGNAYGLGSVYEATGVAIVTELGETNLAGDKVTVKFE